MDVDNITKEELKVWNIVKAQPAEDYLDSNVIDKQGSRETEKNVHALIEPRKSDHELHKSEPGSFVIMYRPNNKTGGAGRRRVRESARYDRFSIKEHVTVPSTGKAPNELTAGALIFDHNGQPTGNLCFYPYSLLALSGSSKSGIWKSNSPSGQEGTQLVHFLFTQKYP